MRACLRSAAFGTTPADCETVSPSLRHFVPWSGFSLLGGLFLSWRPLAACRSLATNGFKPSEPRSSSSSSLSYFLLPRCTAPMCSSALQESILDAGSNRDFGSLDEKSRLHLLARA